MFSRWILFKADEGTGGSGGGGEGTSGGTGDGGSGSGSGAGESQEGTQGTQDGAQGRQSGDDALAEVRREAAKYRTELRSAQDRIKELEGQSQTELEKAQGKATETEKKLGDAEEKVKMLTARVLAGEVGIEPSARADAARLLDWSKIEDPADEEQVVKALKALVKEKPYLLGRAGGGSDGGAGGERGSQKTDMNQRIREASGRH